MRGIVFAAFLVLSGCAAGYGEVRLNATTYRLTYRGGSRASETTARAAALKRAAAVTLRDGFVYFVVRDEDSETSYRGARDLAGRSYVRARPTATLTFSVVGPEDEARPGAYNARMILGRPQ